MILVGIACAFAGLCYAEMASAVPVAGSAYTYAYATMGELIAWVIGWDLVLEYAAGAATVGVGWSGHLVSLLQQLGIVLPPHLTNAPTQWCTDSQVGTVAGCAHAGLNMTGATRQPPGRLHRGGDEHDPGDRDQGVGARQQPDRHPEGGDRPADRRRRPRPPQHRQLDAADSAEHGRMGHLRSVRHPARRRPRLLRLHRLRRGLDRGPGSQEPAARHADRHSRLARHLHLPLRDRVGGADRHRPLHEARGQCSGGRRDAPDRRAGVDPDPDRRRRGPRPRPR